MAWRAKRHVLGASMGWLSKSRARAGLAESRVLLLAGLLACGAGPLSVVQAGSLEQALRIHQRLAGVPPAEQVLLDMADDIDGTGGDLNGDGTVDAEDAAYRAMEHPAFYSVTLKNFATPWTNRDRDVFAELNDYTATVIGIVRDDVPFNTMLSANILYHGGTVQGVPPYSMTNNDHYRELELRGVNLRDALIGDSQSSLTDLPPQAIAGVISTRAAARAFFIAGTNRAMFRYTLLNHLCYDLEQLKDTTRVPDRIRQDVSRSPGGDSRIFLNNCIGCHSGMDPMAQAYAYYDFDETAARIVYTPGQVQPKYFRGEDTFPAGYRTPDDQWSNYWRTGPNTWLGWDTGRPGSGSGAAPLGDELANSDAFARCQVKKVLRNVCMRDPVDQADRDQVAAMTASFKNGYRMKQVFAEAAVYCRGQ